MQAAASASAIHITAVVDFACPWCAVSIAIVRSSLRRSAFHRSALTTVLQLHAHLDSLALSRPATVFNIVYLPRILFPCQHASSETLAVTPCMLTASVSRALQGADRRVTDASSDLSPL